MSAQREYQKLIAERLNDLQIKLVIGWLEDLSRKPAEVAFTEGPARQLGYAIERALRLAATTHAAPDFHATPLRRAAQAVVDRWDAPLWKDAPSTAMYIHELRRAIEQDRLYGQPQEIIAKYGGKDGRRDWVTAGAWLYPGQAIAVVDAKGAG